jgi:hypothetical protein
MFHLVARSIDGAPLFWTWAEARRLWDGVVRATPGRVALMLMPNHVHLVHGLDVREPLAAAVAGYTRWWNHRHGRTGPLFQVLPPAQPLVGMQKVRRQIRYVHLNASRAGLARDPLAWAFSTHRDACGLASPGVVARARDVAAFHKYVSSDPRVDVNGTELPSVSLSANDPREVLHAVSAVTRTPLSWITDTKVPARALYLRAALLLCPDVDRVTIGELVRVGRNGAARAARGEDPRVAVVARAVGDPRFPALHDRRLPWSDAPPGSRWSGTSASNSRPPQST